MNRKEQLKQAIEYSCENYEFRNPDQNTSYFHGINDAITNIEILQHAEPEIMKQAGWVREEETHKMIVSAYNDGAYDMNRGTQGIPCHYESGTDYANKKFPLSK